MNLALMVFIYINISKKNFILKCNQDNNDFSNFFSHQIFET
jgi:hypothetical protein